MAINVYKHVDSASSGGGDGTTWATSGANAAYTAAEMETFLEGAIVAGDVIFVKDGTYTLGDEAWNSSARDATAASPNAIIGVKSSTTNTGSSVVYSDWSRLDADRPSFDCGTANIVLGDYMIVRNCKFNGETDGVVSAGASNTFENCYFDNDYGSNLGRRALTLRGTGVAINCEFTSLITKEQTRPAPARGFYSAIGMT